jgi:hypothetical protein
MRSSNSSGKICDKKYIDEGVTNVYHDYDENVLTRVRDTVSNGCDERRCFTERDEGK